MQNIPLCSLYLIFWSLLLVNSSISHDRHSRPQFSYWDRPANENEDYDRSVLDNHRIGYSYSSNSWSVKKSMNKYVNDDELFYDINKVPDKESTNNESERSVYVCRENRHIKRLADNLVHKTGTTIVGLCCAEGVVLGADTRTTSGPLVMNKGKHKIHELCDNIHVCTAGTVGDCDFIVNQARYDIAVHAIEHADDIIIHNDHRVGKYSIDVDSFSSICRGIVVPVSVAVKSIARSFRSKSSGSKGPQGVFIIGGKDDNKVEGVSTYHLYSIANGMTNTVPYCAMGSGATKAYAIIEAELNMRGITPDSYHPLVHSELTLKDAENIVRGAVLSGIQNDLGSGSHVDLVIISKNDVKVHRELSSDETRHPDSCEEVRETFDGDLSLGRKIKVSSKPSGLVDVDYIFDL